MDHHEAIQRGAVEKYLLNQMSPAERDEFEEHYFDCPECAEDLRATAAFLDAAKKELKRGFDAGSATKLDEPRLERPSGDERNSDNQSVDKKSLDKKRVDTRSRFGFLWRPAFLSPVMGALLLVIMYQNAVVYPRLAADAAASRSPEILAPVSLIGGNSRGAAIPSITLTRAQPLLLSLDIPTAERFSAYTCVLVAPSGAIVWRVPVSAEQAKDTVSIRIPAGDWRSGEYRLIVQGHSPSPEQEPAELARYRFTLNSSH
jgi:Putative zinc-finger